jgi:hypothetical protein
MGAKSLLPGPVPAIHAVDDLSGKEVFVRKSSSFYESLTALNQRLKKEGKKEVILKEAPENLETEDFIEMANAGLIRILIVDKPIAEFWKQVFPNITLHPEATLRTAADFNYRRSAQKYISLIGIRIYFLHGPRNQWLTARILSMTAQSLITETIFIGTSKAFTKYRTIQYSHILFSSLACLSYSARRAESTKRHRGSKILAP